MKTDGLKALLTAAPGVGAPAVKLLRGRWLLDYFQKQSGVRLEHRQALERAHPEAFADEKMIKRILEEVEQSLVEKRRFGDKPMTFPGFSAMSQYVGRASPYTSTHRGLGSPLRATCPAAAAGSRWSTLTPKLGTCASVGSMCSSGTTPSAAGGISGLNTTS